MYKMNSECKSLDLTVAWISDYHVSLSFCHFKLTGSIFIQTCINPLTDAAAKD